MANNSTPRLKVYRLDNGYIQENDNDVRSMIDDELLPVEKKNVNPFYSEEMVGVRARQDTRVVIEDSNYSLIAIKVVSSGNYIVTSEPICCDGWVLGKGNIDVFVYRGATQNVDVSVDINAIRNYNSSDSINYASLTGNGWTPISRKFWDYTVESKKSYVIPYSSSSNSSGSDYFEDLYDELRNLNSWQDCVSMIKPLESEYQIHELDWITFKVGALLFETNEFFTGGYSGFVPIVNNTTSSDTVYSGMIVVRYKKYCELDSYPVFNSSIVHCAPFGDIYNGNKGGRCIHVTEGNEEITVNVIENSGQVIDNSKMNYYEGNYLFKRRIYPFRVKVLYASGVTQQDFVDDGIKENSNNYSIDGNGSATVECESSWFMDDIMKPVVFERLLVDDGVTDYERKIFKQLSKKQVTVQYQQNSSTYKVTLNSTYYSTGVGNTRIYPKEIFLAYNYVDDSLGDIFDFNYDYSAFTETTVKYGYENNGKILLPQDATFPEYVYLKRSLLAVSSSSNRDETIDLNLTSESENSVSFSMSGIITGDGSTPESKEKNRIINGLGSLWVDSNHPLKLYVDGKGIAIIAGDTGGNPISATIGGVSGYSVSYSNGNVTITGTNANSITEIMVSYYERHAIAYQKDNNVNPYCIGFRIPCYEKVKSATLFVSSYPNWLKGHVNNDLDVFYGNKLYSGTQVSNSSQVSYNDIYPQYVKDGWYAMYSEGAIEFNEAKEEINYFDVLNYQSANFDATAWNNISPSIDNIMPNYWEEAGRYALLYYKVRYNVAHYDGIKSVMRGRLDNYSKKGGTYRYALLEDDEHQDAVDKRLVKRDDSVIRTMLEIGRTTVPSSIEADLEEPEQLKSKVLNDNSFVVLSTENDRISSYAIPNGNHVVFAFSNVVTHEEIVTTNLNASHGSLVRVHAKVEDFNDTDGIEKQRLAIGVETNPFSITYNDSATFLTSVFSVSDENMKWVYLPDEEDVIIGEYDSENQVYRCDGIESVQTSDIIIDGNASPMTYKYGEGGTTNQISDGNVPLGTGDNSGYKNRVYVYHNDNASWSYDICFEVLSYRYNNSLNSALYNSDHTSGVTYVELIAYRVMTK